MSQVEQPKTTGPRIRVELKNDAQRKAWAMFRRVDVLFLLGPAGVGKSFLAMALAIDRVDEQEAEKILITRPIIESEESLGYLPGDIGEKTDPYMMPLYDQIRKLKEKDHKEFRRQYVETGPLAYMRGRTFENMVCILDEAQNCNYKQFRLYLSRLGRQGKIIVTGDPDQTDVRDSALAEVVHRLEGVQGIGIVRFDKQDIVRHPVVERILTHLPNA